MNAKINALTPLRFQRHSPWLSIICEITHSRAYAAALLRKPIWRSIYSLSCPALFLRMFMVRPSRRKGAACERFSSPGWPVYPAHLAMMIVFLLYVAYLGSIGFSYNAERYRPELFLWHATLLDAWGIDRGLTWNFPAWSISAEFSAYLIFPFIVGPLMRLPPRIAAYLLLLLIGAFALLNGPLRLTDRTFDFSIVRILPEFIMGPPAYRARDYLVAFVGSTNVAFVSAIVILVVFIWTMAPDLLIVASFVALIVLGAAITGSLAAAVTWHPLIYLGEISYSLYLVHAFVLSVLYNAFKVPRISAFAPAALRDWLVIIVALVAASALYHLVEKPARKFIRGTYADPRLSSRRMRALP